MCDIALVEYTSEEVDENCDYADDSEDCAWSDGLFCWLSCYAGCSGEDFEMIGAFVVEVSNIGCCGLRSQRVFVAVKGDDGGFPAYWGVLLRPLRAAPTW